MFVRADHAVSQITESRLPHKRGLHGKGGPPQAPPPSKKKSRCARRKQKAAEARLQQQKLEAGDPAAAQSTGDTTQGHAPPPPTPKKGEAAAPAGDGTGPSRAADDTERRGRIQIIQTDFNIYDLSWAQGGWEGKPYEARDSHESLEALKEDGYRVVHWEAE